MTLADTQLKAKPATDTSVAGRLLDWYDLNHRELPWRVSPEQANAGLRPDPYRVWLSEIMLQQTTVATVKGYYQTFLERWPDVKALAAASQDDVMKAWAGLGYYSRARNLKKCADIVATSHGGEFPGSEAGLKDLPGIGDYTAAAIAAIAFGRPAAVVDGNIERVICRHEAISTPLPKAKTMVRSHVATLLPVDRPGDFAQAMMDLGAMICTPTRPACPLCPLNESCMALQQGVPEDYPLKAAKAEKPLRKAAAFVAVRQDGAILLRRRPDTGLLGGMSEVPTSHFTSRIDGEQSKKAAPFRAQWSHCGTARHIFTHFRLELDVFRGEAAPEVHLADGWWSPAHELGKEALPTVMRKVLAVAGIELGPRPQEHRARKT